MIYNQQGFKLITSFLRHHAVKINNNYYLGCTADVKMAISGSRSRETPAIFASIQSF
uniref:hypothetical protein n=1 Tax=Providencia alcalifaciens TaxID=126385 RepID=UPI00208DD180